MINVTNLNILSARSAEKGSSCIKNEKGTFILRHDYIYIVDG